ncbi:MAG: hypothetical protein SGJ04_10195 [Bacteroidota bacterium]|nr:hypothetical protein [Bacteroidota bacterium]
MLVDSPISAQRKVVEKDEIDGQIAARAKKIATWSGYVEPLYLIDGSLKIGADIKVGPNWWIFTELAYGRMIIVKDRFDAYTEAAKNSSSDYKKNKEDIATLGSIYTGVKLFFGNPNKKVKSGKFTDGGQGWYNQSGLFYRYSYVNFYRFGWTKVDRYNETYYTFSNFLDYSVSHQLGVQTLIGYKKPIGNSPICFDPYVGISLRTAFTTNDELKLRDYTRDSRDFSYEGITPMAGLRIGLMF